MGFGKFIKDVAGGIQDMNDERNERKRREQVRDSQRKADIAAGKFCKICMRMGEFDNQCQDCKLFPVCDNCMHKHRNADRGTICRNCFPRYNCDFQNCGYIFDDKCIHCNRYVCQGHWGAFFVYGKNQVFSCVYPEHRGNVCKSCVENRKTGTFKKKYICTCGNELHQKIIG